MPWQLLLLLILGSAVVLMLSGMPVAFCFTVVNIIGVFLLWGGVSGLEELTYSIMASVTTFSLMPVPLFILMGELMFHSGIASVLIETIDKWLGRLPGRLGLLSVGAGALFSTLTAVSMASVAMLGDVLTPEMENRGYKKAMSMGPILAAGGLAHMIPPSDLGVILGALGRISIGKILMAIIFPGILLASLYAVYIVIRCWLQPSVAPPYEVPHIPIKEKIVATAWYVLPVGVVIFLVIGLIFLGVVTPTEAAATGALGSFALVAWYRKLNWEVVKKSFAGTLRITVMVFMILVGAKAFTQILAYSGATTGLVEAALSLPLSPLFIIVSMQVVILFMGCFMEVVSIFMITLPILVPVVLALGFDTVWFAVLFLVNTEMALVTPPFGMSLFVMKGVAPPGTTIGDIFRAALPFLGLMVVAMALIMAFPEIALWLPSIMR